MCKMEWKDIKGYEGIYQCNENGEVLNLKRNSFVKPYLTSRSNVVVGLCVGNIRKTFVLSRLVYETFVGEIPKGWFICHKDRNNSNNKLSNLKLYKSIKERYEDDDPAVKKINPISINKHKPTVYAETLEGEKWVDLINTNGLYKISNLGRVKKTKTNKLIQPYIKRKTYNWIKIRTKHFNIHASLHRLVYESFYGNIKEGNEVDHINSNSLDDRLENLKEVTKQENRRNPNSLIKIEIGRQRALEKSNGKSGVTILKVSLKGNIIEKYKSYKECCKINKITKYKLMGELKDKQNIKNGFYFIKEKDYKEDLNIAMM